MEFVSEDPKLVYVSIIVERKKERKKEGRKEAMKEGGQKLLMVGLLYALNKKTM